LELRESRRGNGMSLFYTPKPQIGLLQKQRKNKGVDFSTPQELQFSIR